MPALEEDELTKGGVYAGEVSIDDPPESYEDQVAEVAKEINSNLNFIRTYIESLQATDQQAYKTFRQEYEEVLYQYNQALTEARTTGEQAPSYLKDKYVKNLMLTLEYTKTWIESIRASGWEFEDVQGSTPEDAMQEPGTSSLPSPPPSTAMVTHSGETAQNDGVVTTWWKNMKPGWKTAMKIMAVAGALYGGKYMYDRWLKPGDKA